MKCCQLCEYFCGFTKRPRKGERVLYGECCRYPPIVNDGEVDVRQSPRRVDRRRPRVRGDMICGEYTPREQD